MKIPQASREAEESKLGTAASMGDITLYTISGGAIPPGWVMADGAKSFVRLGFGSLWKGYSPIGMLSLIELEAKTDRIVQSCRQRRAHGCAVHGRTQPVEHAKENGLPVKGYIVLAALNFPPPSCFVPGEASTEAGLTGRPLAAVVSVGI